MALGDDDSGGYDPMAGGPSGYYNPAFGMMAIQNPEMFVSHLASNGVQPPADFDENFDHIDAHKALGASLKDQDRMPQGLPGMPTEQQGSFDERFSDSFRGAPGSMRSFAPSGDMPIPASPSDAAAPPKKSDTPVTDWLGQTSIGRALLGPDKGATPPPPPPAPPKMPPKEEKRNAERGEPWGGRPHVEPEPTAVADTPATSGGSTVPAGTAQERPGNLNTEDPAAKAQSSATEKKEAKGKSDKDNSWDTFGKALAGLSAIKPPPPVFPHPGNVPHPSNQISRSAYPTELLKEMSQIGRPGTMVHLGALLKGR